MDTRKILMAIDINDPVKDFNEFLYPDCDYIPAKLTGLKKGEVFNTGVVTLTGTITENDIFARIIDNSDKNIKSVRFVLRSLIYYIQEVRKFKIGNIVKVIEADNEFGFELVKIKDRVSITKKNKMP